MVHVIESKALCILLNQLKMAPSDKNTDLVNFILGLEWSGNSWLFDSITK